MSWLNPLSWFRGRPTAERAMTYGDLARKGWVAAGGAPGGVPVTHDSAVGLSAVMCASRVISEDIASLPKRVYQGEDDGAMPLPNDLVGWLLRNPNPEQTGPVFWSAFQHNANLWGFAAAEIVRDGRGVPVELWLVPSPEWRLERRAGRLTFEAPGLAGGRTPMDPDDVLFLPGISPDGGAGYRLLHAARMTLGTAAAVQSFAAARFRNGMKPSGAIKHPGILSDAARENMRASWKALYGGPENAGSAMILEEGTEWVPFDTAHNDQLQLAQLAEFYVVEVARLFNISPTKLHQLGRATWSNLETLNREHVTTCLGPWLAKHEAEIGRKLLRSDRTGRHCRHVLDRLLQADTATRYEAWSKALAAGWLTPNEVRAREDMPPKAGGDELHRPLNQGPASGPAKPAPTPEPSAPDADPASPPA